MLEPDIEIHRVGSEYGHGFLFVEAGIRFTTDSIPDSNGDPYEVSADGFFFSSHRESFIYLIQETSQLFRECSPEPKEYETAQIYSSKIILSRFELR